MRKYGNYFEILSCKIYDSKNRRTEDWVTIGAPKGAIYRNRGFLEYKDWDKNGFICGGFYILKKEVWEKCPWDEHLIWGQGEDVNLAFDYYEKGFVARFNKFASCTTLLKRGELVKGWYTFKYNNKKFITLKDRPLLRRIKVFITIIYRRYLYKL